MTNRKIGFIVSEFLPTKNLIFESLKNLNNNDLIVYFLPVYSPTKKSNNKLLKRIIKETNYQYIFYKILDTLFIKFFRFISRKSIRHYVIENNVEHHLFDLNYEKLSTKVKEDKIDILVLLTNQYIPEKVLNSSRELSINVHLAKLPEYGGLFNQFWMMLNNEQFSFVSIQIASKQLDSGSVLLEDKIEIDYNKSMMSLYHETSILAGKLLFEFLSSVDKYFDPEKEYENVEPIIRNLPNKKDIKDFKQKKYKLFTFKSLIKAI